MDWSTILTLLACLVVYLIVNRLQKPSKPVEMGPNITEIQSTAAFEEIVKSLAPNQLLVMDFHATWCGPCHAIAPIYNKLADQYTHAKFVKVDVDRQRELAARYAISAMPTFKFIKGGNVIAEIRGASPPQLNKLVQQHAGPVPAAKAAPAAAASTSSKPSGPVDNTVPLHSLIASKGLTCLNESSSHPLSSILGSNTGPKGTSYLESDVDPELLISIPFIDPVKIRSISIFSGVSPSQAPKTVKLFVNQLSLDFADADSLPPTQELDLTPDDTKGNKVELKLVRFQNVRSLHILVKDNQEDEETTRIDSIDLFGESGQVTDKGPLPKIGHAEDE